MGAEAKDTNEVLRCKLQGLGFRVLGFKGLGF